jgi:hypothetical protein
MYIYIYIYIYRYEGELAATPCNVFVSKADTSDVEYKVIVDLPSVWQGAMKADKAS